MVPLSEFTADYVRSSFIVFERFECYSLIILLFLGGVYLGWILAMAYYNHQLKYVKRNQAAFEAWKKKREE